MNIETISEDVTYYRKNTEFVLEVKGKEVVVQKWYLEDYSYRNSETDSGIEIISNTDFLTDDEQDQLNDYIMEL